MNSVLSNTEECVSDLENRIMEITPSEQQKHKRKFKKMKTAQLYEITLSMTTFNTLEGFQMEKREKVIKCVFEKIMTENFLNLKKSTDTQEQEEQRIQNKMNPNRPTPRHYNDFIMGNSI